MTAPPPQDAAHDAPLAWLYYQHWKIEQNSALSFLGNPSHTMCGRWRSHYLFFWQQMTGLPGSLCQANRNVPIQVNTNLEFLVEHADLPTHKHTLKMLWTTYHSLIRDEGLCDPSHTLLLQVFATWPHKTRKSPWWPGPSGPSPSSPSPSHLEVGRVAAHIQDHIVGFEIEQSLLAFGDTVSFCFMQRLLLHSHRHMSILQDPARWEERGWITPCTKERKKFITQRRFLS